MRDFMDAVAPGLLLAQGIGRWGNWWNQELYGKPTDLPWGVKIDFEHRRRGLREQRDLPADLPLRVHLRPRRGGAVAPARPALPLPAAGALRALRLLLHGFGRFVEELLRIDPAHHFVGLRLNAWVSIVVFCISTAFFVWWQFLRGGEHEPRRPRRREPEGPAMAIPKGRVRHSR